MRRFMVSVIALSIAAAPAMLEAQTPRTERRPAMAGARAGAGLGEHIIAQREALGLSPDQVASIRRIGTQLQEQNLPLLEQVRGEVQAKRAELTDEQRQQIRERRTEARARMQERRSEMRERAAGMTAEQREQMREQMRERMKERRADGSLPRMPFAGVPGAELSDETRAAMQQIRQNSEQAIQQIRSVLTDEQQAKLRELRPTQRRGPAGAESVRRRGGRIPGG